MLGSVIVGLILPVAGGKFLLLNSAALLGCMFMLAVIVGIIESTMARLRLLRVPQLLVAAGALSLFAFILSMR